jgi:hypothetical protein
MKAIALLAAKREEATPDVWSNIGVLRHKLGGYHKNAFKGPI